MTKTSLLILLAAVIFFAACKKNSPQPQMYYYEKYIIGKRYPSSSPPSDSVSFVDSIQTSYLDFRGDTINTIPDDRFYLSDSYYQKRYQNFEVYRYTK